MENTKLLSSTWVSHINNGLTVSRLLEYTTKQNRLHYLPIVTTIHINFRCVSGYQLAKLSTLKTADKSAHF